MSGNWSNRYLREIVVKWFERSLDDRQGFDDFDRFIALWISFDACACNESGATERPMINWVETNSSMVQGFQQSWSGLDASILALQSKGSIPNHITGDSHTIKNPHDFKEVMDAVYLVRNNLFHGHKSPDYKDDRDYVSLAFHILSVLMEPIVKQLNY